MKDLSLLGKFVYYYPANPTGPVVGPAPLPNTDGTPHPAFIYNVREDETVDIMAWAHGHSYGLEGIALWREGPSEEPLAVFPEDDAKRLAYTEPKATKAHRDARWHK
jgi:hypothetical protein